MEVNKFSALDEEWWDPRKNPLIHMNAVRMKYIQSMVQQHRGKLYNNKLPLEGIQALDIGCGGGLACESLARLGATVTGVDPSEALVQAAVRHSELDPRTEAINYIGGSTAEEIAMKTPESFDVICLLEVIEHVTDIPALMQATSTLLKPDGLLILSTINRTLKSYLLTIVGAEYVMGYIPVGTHDWSKYLSPDEVKQVTASVSLQAVNVSGMVLSKPPLFGKWDWKLDAGDIDVNWIATYRKRQADYR
jgi:ubiquinone biosynthesis O-methyltransferase